jgi:hypothetical protein
VSHAHLPSATAVFLVSSPPGGPPTRQGAEMGNINANDADVGSETTDLPSSLCCQGGAAAT